MRKTPLTPGGEGERREQAKRAMCRIPRGSGDFRLKRIDWAVRRIVVAHSRMARTKRAPQQAELARKLQAAVEQLLSLGAVDLSRRVENGELPPAHGREPELERIFAAIAERRSVLLVG